MKKTKSLYQGHWFPVSAIYFAPKDVPLSDESIRRWTDEFGAGFMHRVRAARRKPGLMWYLDEMYVTPHSKATAKRFFWRVLAVCPDAPKETVADHQLRSYLAAKVAIPEPVNVMHFVKTATQLNNRAENSHQPTREREWRIPQEDFLRGVRGFHEPRRTQNFSRASGRYGNTLRLSSICCVPPYIANNSWHDSSPGFFAWREFTDFAQKSVDCFLTGSRIGRRVTSLLAS